MAEVSYWTSLVISQHWFRQWLGAARHQAIAWANVDTDLCHHKASQSLGHNELTKASTPRDNEWINALLAQVQIKDSYAHWDWDKMATIMQKNFQINFEWILLYIFDIEVSLKFVPKDSIDWFRWWLGAKQATNYYLH